MWILAENSCLLVSIRGFRLHGYGLALAVSGAGSSMAQLARYVHRGGFVRLTFSHHSGVASHFLNSKHGTNLSLKRYLL